MSGSSLSVTELCELCAVSRSGFYRWCKAESCRIRHELADMADFEKILEAYSFRGYAKGYRGIQMRLKRMGIIMNHKKIKRLMKKYGLKCPVRKANPYRRMAKAIRTDVIADNYLNRDFKKYGPRQIILTDITYIKFKGKFMYLSVMTDCCTKQVLAYKLSDSLKVDFVLDTLKELMLKYGDELPGNVYVHSDQGCHYTSIAFRELLKDSGLRQSMSRRGNCWDNAPQESFFGTMKEELKPYIRKCNSVEELRSRIDDWIDYYNNDRLQSGLKEQSPNEYYESLAA